MSRVSLLLPEGRGERHNDGRCRIRASLTQLHVRASVTARLDLILSEERVAYIAGNCTVYGVAPITRCRGNSVTVFIIFSIIVVIPRARASGINADYGRRTSDAAPLPAWRASFTRARTRAYRNYATVFSSTALTGIKLYSSNRKIRIRNYRDND